MELEGKCLWFDERDGHGIVEDIHGNEYYTDISAIVDRKPLVRNEAVRFVLNKKIKDTKCAIVLARGSLLKKPLSFTGYKLYHECPAKYDLHYNKRLRSDVSPAFFIFGSAIDKGCNVLLEGGGILVAIDAVEQELKRLLTEKVEYDERDYDGELIETKEELLESLREIGYKGDSVDTLVSSLLEKVANGQELSTGQTSALGMAMSASMLAKSVIMLAAYHAQVLPKISKVLKVQKEVKRGIADAEVEMFGVEGNVILDNKTAYRLYEQDAVTTSIQLAGYGGENGCYVVMDKNIKKNRIKTCSKCGNVSTGRHKTCDKIIVTSDIMNNTKGDRCNGEWSETIQPEAVIQIVKDPISKDQRELVESSYVETEKAIKCGAFPKNLNNCVQWFGKKKARCPYYDYCRSGKMDGLIKKEDDNEKPK